METPEGGENPRTPVPSLATASPDDNSRRSMSGEASALNPAVSENQAVANGSDQFTPSAEVSSAAEFLRQQREAELAYAPPNVLISSNVMPGAVSVVVGDQVDVTAEPRLVGEQTIRAWETIQVARPVDITERTFERPTVRHVQTFVPSIQVREVTRQLDTPVTQVEEVPGPQVDHQKIVDRYVEVPVVSGEEIRYVPKFEVQERIIETTRPEVKWVERFHDRYEIKEVIKYVESDNNVEVITRFLPKKADGAAGAGHLEGLPGLANVQSLQSQDGVRFENGEAVPQPGAYGVAAQPGFNGGIVGGGSVGFSGVSCPVASGSNGDDGVTNSGDPVLRASEQRLMSNAYWGSEPWVGGAVPQYSSSEFGSSGSGGQIGGGFGSEFMAPLPSVETLLVPRVTQVEEIEKIVPMEQKIPLVYVVPKPVEIQVDVPQIVFEDHFVPVPVRRHVTPRVLFTDEVLEVECRREKPVLIVEDQYKAVPVDARIKIRERDIRISPIDPATVSQADYDMMWRRVNADMLDEYMRNGSFNNPELQRALDGMSGVSGEADRSPSVDVDMSDVIPVEGESDDEFTARREATLQQRLADATGGAAGAADGLQGPSEDEPDGGLGPIPLHPGSPLMATHLQNTWLHTPTHMIRELYTPDFMRMSRSALDSILNPSPHQVNLTAEQISQLGPTPADVFPVCWEKIGLEKGGPIRAPVRPPQAVVDSYSCDSAALDGVSGVSGASGELGGDGVKESSGGGEAASLGPRGSLGGGLLEGFSEGLSGRADGDDLLYRGADSGIAARCCGALCACAFSPCCSSSQCGCKGKCCRPSSQPCGCSIADCCGCGREIAFLNERGEAVYWSNDGSLYRLGGDGKRVYTDFDGAPIRKPPNVAGPTSSCCRTGAQLDVDHAAMPHGGSCCWESGACTGDARCGGREGNGLGFLRPQVSIRTSQTGYFA